MKDARHGLRVKCDSKCVLVLGESVFDGILEDVSLSGALVRVRDRRLAVNLGSRCGLCLCHDSNMCRGEYACQVTRVNHKDVGLSFVNAYLQ